MLCAHGGQATPLVPSFRVFVGGQPIATQAPPYVVAGCPFVSPGGNGPCVTAQWTSAALRVFAGGQPVLIQGSFSVCAPTGTPLSIITTQTRVTAT